jgi:hypothetical protein
MSGPRYFAELCLIATDLRWPVIALERDCSREEMGQAGRCCRGFTESFIAARTVAGAQALVADALIH